MKRKSVLILSGGLDSTTLLYHMVRDLDLDVYALSVNYGQRHLREVTAAMASCKRLGVKLELVDLSSLVGLISNSALTSQSIEVPEGAYNEESMKATVVPNRNMILLSAAIGYAVNIGAPAVYYGAHSGDHSVYPDCRPEFVERMQEVSRIANWQSVEIMVPFLFKSKTGILREGLRLGVDYSLTWTCYRGGAKACGKCGSCDERLGAFKELGVKDPLEYED